MKKYIKAIMTAVNEYNKYFQVKEKRAIIFIPDKPMPVFPYPIFKTLSHNRHGQTTLYNKYGNCVCVIPKENTLIIENIKTEIHE